MATATALAKDARTHTPFFLKRVTMPETFTTDPELYSARPTPNGPRAHALNTVNPVKNDKRMDTTPTNRMDRPTGICVLSPRRMQTKCRRSPPSTLPFHPTRPKQSVTILTHNQGRRRRSFTIHALVQASHLSQPVTMRKST
ncbi:hypothetical protein CF319_g5813 [Tilletia indica]|nr:hypothetical protein CF319_g5813 [Tilletia indica]